MQPELLRIMVALVLVIGAGATAYGFVSAFADARRQRRLAAERIESLERLQQEESVEHTERLAAYMAGLPDGEEERAAYEAQHEKERNARHERWTREFAKADLVRPSAGNLSTLPAREAERLLGLVLDASRKNLITAGVGLALVTVASVASIFVP